LTQKWGGDQLSVIRGLSIFFDKTGVMTPNVFTHFVSKFTAVPDVTVFFHLHPVETPTVGEAERYAISRFPAIPGCYRLVLRHGFMDEVISPDLAALIYDQVRKFIIRQAQQKEVVNDVDGGDDDDDDDDDNNNDGQAGNKETLDTERAQDKGAGTAATAEKGDDSLPAKSTTSATDATTLATSAPSGSKTGEKIKTPATELPIELRDQAVADELAHLDRAYAAKIMYVVGKEQMRIKPDTALWRKALLSVFLWIRDNTRAKIANLRLAMERVVEVGFVKEI
jgi:KUP system potassium uptake protein